MMLILIASAAAPPIGRAFIPSGYQSYYVLGDSDSIVRRAMDPATGYNNATAQPWSLFSIVSYLDMATIYVDQRQNGYGFDTSDFSGADAVFEMDMGAVLTMTNWGSPPYYTITPPGSGHLVSGSLDTDPSNNVDDWEVTIYRVGMLVEKTLATPAIAPIGGTVKFNVTITNTGTVPLLTVPLRDEYDPTYLDYESTTPTPDAVDETTGTLDWNDLTGAGSLPPGSAIKIQLTFKALKSTSQSVTVDTATVEDASAGQFGTVSGSASAHVKIASAVGGEVIPPDPTGARATTLTILLLVGAAAYALTRKTP